jgi:hypothetical protein
MTTVINLNILNFFKLKLNRFAVNNNVSVHNQGPEKRDNPPSEREVVIDITPQSRGISREAPVMKSFPKIPVSLPDYSQPKVMADRAVINKTYDREGKTVQSGHPKGMYIDSFV